MSLKSVDVLNNYRQYRNFDRLYLLKVKKNDDLKLKIFNLSQKCLFKKTFSVKNLKRIDIYQLLFTKKDYSMFLEALVQKKMLDCQYFPSIKQSISRQNYLQMAKKAIRQFKPKVFVEPEGLKDFCCPITLELFRNPVVDDHGHTFEKEAIENYFETKEKKECPINRQLIKSLAPNRLVRQTIEEWQKKDPIPTFSLFKKENTKLTQSSLQMAKDYIEEGEYKYALESYAKAFKFTKKWQDYEALPVLFARMQEIEKTTLAYLYLAFYQLEGNRVARAIQTLEKCQSLVEIRSPVHLLLFNLYRINKQSEKALKLAIQMTKSLSKKNPKQAITFYKEALRIKPDQFDLYSPFSQLLKTPMDKANIFLKGAHCATRTGAYKEAENLFQEAYKYSKSSFIDQMLYLQLLHKQQKFSDIKSLLLALAKDYEKKNLFLLMIKAYKMLFQIEKKSDYCQKIISAYDKLQKPQKQMRWYFESLKLLIKEKKGREAEEIALEALKKANEKECIFIYKNLEKVYINWHKHKLENLWGKLGQAYIKNNQLAEAEEVYRGSFDRFGKLDYALQVASLLVKQNKKSEGVQSYLRAFFLALLSNDLEKLALCIRNIRQIDPKMESLESDETVLLLTHTTILTLSKKLQETKNKNILLEKKISSLEKSELANKIEDLTKKWQKTKNKNIIFEKKVSLLEKKLEIESKKIKKINDSVKELMKAKRIKEKRKEDLLKIPFGKAEWAKYFGDVGEEPPLPLNIVQILKSPCPIWPGKKIADTHLLVLIPAKVNGQPFTLNSLEGLIKKPKTGFSIKCSIGGHYTKKEFGNRSFPFSYWILFTKGIIPDSNKEGYTRQCKLVKELSNKISVTYDIPHALEVAVAISTHHIRSGERFSNIRWTRCKERLAKGGWPLIVGGCNTKGVVLYLPETHTNFINNSVGMSGVRKL
jgi:hypothetical protein